MSHTKYPTILSVVKAVFTLVHGNSEVGKGFPDSGKTATIDRTPPSGASTNNIQITTDGLKVIDSLPLPHYVPITSSFTKLGQSAHKKYCFGVDEEEKKGSWKKKTEVTNGKLNKTKKNLEKKKQLEIEPDQVKSRQVYFLFAHVEQELHVLVLTIQWLHLVCLF